MSNHRPTVPRNRAPCDLPSEYSTNSFWHTEPSALLTAHRSTRDLPPSADIVIIGSGITGASIAHHLLTPPSKDEQASKIKKDQAPSVVMLEAREACWGATGRNGGHCQPLPLEHPHEPDVGRFELANFHALKEIIEERSIDCEFAAQAGVRAIYSRQFLTEVELALFALQESAPYLAKLIKLVTDKEELEVLRVPTAVAAIVTSVAGRLWPYKLVTRILEDLVTSTELNGTFNLQTLTPVECLAPYDHNRWTVKTNRGCIVASKLVLATNGYTSHLLPNFADLIVPCRGQMSSLLPTASLRGDKRLKTSFGFTGELGDYLIQRPNERGGHLMFGGGRHKAMTYTTDDSVIDDTTAKYLRTRLFETLALPEGKAQAVYCKECLAAGRSTNLPQERPYNLAVLTRPCDICGSPILPKIYGFQSMKELNATHQWTGIMGFSRDEYPWVGPIPERPNMYISAGYTGHGMPNAWLCGKAVALMVLKDLVSEAGEPGDFLREGPGMDKWKADDEWVTAGHMFEAAKEVGMPGCYLVCKERVLRAMDLEDVEVRDWDEVERGRRAGGVAALERVPSGYA